MAFRLLKIGTKFGLAGGAVYYTIQGGLWKDSEHSAELYAKLYKTVAPYVKEVPVEVPELPSIEDLTYTAKNSWNKGVLTTCVFLSDLPNKSVEWSKQGYEYVVKQLEADPQKSSSANKQ